MPPNCRDQKFSLIKKQSSVKLSTFAYKRNCPTFQRKLKSVCRQHLLVTFSGPAKKEKCNILWTMDLSQWWGSIFDRMDEGGGGVVYSVEWFWRDIFMHTPDMLPKLQVRVYSKPANVTHKKGTHIFSKISKVTVLGSHSAFESKESIKIWFRTHNKQPVL